MWINFIVYIILVQLWVAGEKAQPPSGHMREKRPIISFRGHEDALICLRLRNVTDQGGSKMQCGQYIEYECCNFMNGVMTEQKLTEIQYYIICMLHSRSLIAEYHVDHVRWLISDWRSILMGLRWLDNVEIPVLAYYMRKTSTDWIFPTVGHILRVGDPKEYGYHLILVE